VGDVGGVGGNNFRSNSPANSSASDVRNMQDFLNALGNEKAKASGKQPTFSDEKNPADTQIARHCIGLCHGNDMDYPTRSITPKEELSLHAATLAFSAWMPFVGEAGAATMASDGALLGSGMARAAPIAAEGLSS